MDPFIIKCRYRDSFDLTTDPPIILHTYVPSDYPNNNTRKKLLFSDKNENIKTEYHDIELAKSVDLVDSVIDNKYENLFDPFRNVSASPFMNRDAIILSNIDAVFNFNKHTSGYIIKQETKDFNFATIDDGPGGFTEYIFYRNPNSYGYGMTPKENPYNTNILDLTHFNITYGQSGEGDLKKDYKSFIKYIRTVEAIGVNVVIGNSDNNINGTDYMLRLMVALGVIKIGGTFISKIPIIDSRFMIDLLYITSQCFNKITLFKPLSTDTNNKIYYIIAEDARRNNIEWMGYVEESYTSSTRESKSIISLIDKIPNYFVKWVTEYNNLILLYKKYLLDQIGVMEQKNIDHLYDTYKCKAVWNLP